jgi:GT2 family glycosyltransferase
MLRAEFPAVTVLENTATLGFGANHNQVLQRTMDRCQFVLLLNPDTVVPAGAISGLVDYLEAHPQVAICAPQLVDEAGVATPPLRRFLSWPREAVYLSLHISNSNGSPRFWALLNRATGRSASSQPGDGRTGGETVGDLAAPAEGQMRQAVSGACMMVRTAALREIGLFDERFFLYFEEIDLCLRAWQRGWQVAYLPGIQVVHTGGFSTAPRFHSYLRIYLRSCLYLYRKHRGAWAERGLRAWIKLVGLGNVVRWAVLYLVRPRRRDEIAPWLKFSAGLVRGL